MIELTDIDVKILCFIEEHPSIDMESIKARFKNASAVEYRVKLLATQEYRHYGNLPISHPIDNTSYILEDTEDVRGDNGIHSVKRLGTYQITDFGRKEIQDHRRKRKSRRRELWLKNAWIPILVTLATNLIIGGVKWLLPLIQEWLTHTPG